MKTFRIAACILLIASASSGWAVDGLVKDTSGGNGWAGGVSSCTTYNGCLSCGNNVATGAKVCVNLYANGSCSCTVKTVDGQTTCSSSGTCTYRT